MRRIDAKGFTKRTSYTGEPSTWGFLLRCFLAVLLFAPIFLIAWLTDVLWPAWALLLLFFLIGVWLLTRPKRKVRFRSLWAFGMITAALISVILFRPDPAVSFLGTLAREGIRAVVQSPSMDGGLLSHGDSMRYESIWEAPKGYVNQRFELENCAVEILQPKNSMESDSESGTEKGADKNSVRLVYQLHGGGYVYGFTDMYRVLAVRWSKLAGGADVASLDYRFAPKHTFPAALEDAMVGWNYLLEQGYDPNQITVTGDSAGGNLALALVLKLRDEGLAMPGAIVVMSPWGDLAAEGPSHIENLYRDPMFGIPEGKPIPTVLIPPVYAGSAELTQPYLSPVFGTFEGFPPMLIQVGTEEVLLSDSQTIYGKAVAAGTEATLTVYRGMFHMFQLFGDLLPEGRQAWQEVAQFLARQE